MDKATARRIIPLATVGLILVFISGHNGSWFGGCLINGAWNTSTLRDFDCRIWLWTSGQAVAGFCLLGLAAWIYNERRAG